MVEVCTWGGCIRAEGHAGLAEAGKDVLCAAVSTLVYTYSLYLEETGNLERSLTEPGVGIVMPMDPREAGARAVYRAVVGMLEALEKQFPEHLRVRRESE